MVIVVGTSHMIQIATLELKPFLKRLCRKFKACAVAEEMNEEALAEQNCAASIPMQVANALRLSHRFCDPNRTELTKLGIRQENEIRISAFPSTLSESEVATRLAESHAKREGYWLEQLRGLNLWQSYSFAEQIMWHRSAIFSTKRVPLCMSQRRTGHLTTQSRGTRRKRRAHHCERYAAKCATEELDGHFRQH